MTATAASATGCGAGCPMNASTASRASSDGRIPRAAAACVTAPSSESVRRTRILLVAVSAMSFAPWGSVCGALPLLAHRRCHAV